MLAIAAQKSRACRSPRRLRHPVGAQYVSLPQRHSFAIVHPRAVQKSGTVAAEYPAPRRIRLPVLRHTFGNADDRSRRAALARRWRYVGKPGHCVCAMQQPQGQSHTGRSRDAIAERPTQTESHRFSAKLHGFARSRMATLLVRRLSAWIEFRKAYRLTTAAE